MRAKTVDVLHKHLVVAYALPRVIPVELQPDAAEFAWIPVDHRGGAMRVVVESLHVAGIEIADAHVAAVKTVVAQTHAPVRMKLIHALHIPPRLLGVVAVGNGAAVDTRSVISQ